jgi:hypothetical protein
MNSPRSFQLNGFNGSVFNCLAMEKDSLITMYFHETNNNSYGMFSWKTDRGLDNYPNWALEDNVLYHYCHKHYTTLSKLPEIVI